MNGKIDRYIKSKTIIFLDSAPVIYFIEENPAYVSILEEIFTLPIDYTIAEKAADLRAKYGDSGLKIPDAIQLATAICYDAQLFLTNDKRLKKLQQKEIKIITVEELS